ncbi:MAG: metallophosphoesterase [Anaerolineales bacterium]|nr:metallophosphoesterase [Anaerolineales bacterium]
MAFINWLHLSDWHQRGKDFDREVVRDALLHDIGERGSIDSNLESVDFVIFSGDLAYSGAKEEYDAAISTFLNPLLDALGWNSEDLNKFFIVPGNHDVNREVLKLISSDIARQIHSSSSVSEILTTEWKKDLIFSPLNNYSEFVRGFIGKFQNLERGSETSFGSRLELNKASVSIMGLNSSWMSGHNRKLDDQVNDYGFLAVGEPQIHEISKENFNSADIRICVLHHPFSWLIDSDRNIIENRLYELCHFILCGHHHIPNIIVQRGLSGDSIIIPGGASYDRRNPEHPIYANSYNFVSLNLEVGEGIIYFRKWNSRQNRWVKDDETYEGGVYNFKIPQKTAKRARLNTGGLKTPHPMKDDLEKNEIVRLSDYTRSAINHQIDQREEMILTLEHKYAQSDEGGELVFLREEIAAMKQDITRLKGKLDQGDLDAQFRFFIKRSYGLPPRENFIGRNNKLAEIIYLLAPGSYANLIVLKGPSGAGKTALVVEAAYKAIENGLTDYVIYLSAQPRYLETDKITDVEVQFGSLDDLIEVVENINNIPNRETDSKKRIQNIQNLLSEKRYLLIIDNFEVINDKKIHDFLKYRIPSPSKAIIATRYHSADEGYIVNLQRMDYGDAAVLMRVEGQNKAMDSVIKANPETLRRIWLWSSGLPLAMRWLIGLASESAISLDGLLSRLEYESYSEEEDLLLNFLFGQSYNSLPEEMRKVLYAISVFSTHATVDSVIKTCGLDSTIVKSAIKSLVRLSLVQFDDFLARYSLLPITKRFISKIPDISSTILEFHENATEYYKNRFSDMDDATKQSASSLKMMAEERQNLIGLLDWCIANERWELVIDLGLNVNFFLGHLGYYRDRLKYAYPLLEATKHLGDDKLAARVLINEIGWIQQHVGNYKAAEDALWEGIQIAEQIGDKVLAAIARRSIGLMYYRQAVDGKYPEKEASLQKAKSLCELACLVFRESHEQRWEGIALRTMALIENENQNSSGALALFNEALFLHKLAGDLESEALTLSDIGKIHLLLAELDKAEEFFKESMKLDDFHNRRFGMARNRERLAFVESRRGHSESASKYLKQALEIFEDMGATLAAEKARNELADLAHGKELSL